MSGFGRPIADVFGDAYVLAEECGCRRGTTILTYQTEDGSTYGEDVADYFAGPENWFPPDVLACDLARGRVLDIGCGVGRHALAIAETGREVVGIDPSKEAVGVARRRHVDAHVASLHEPPAALGTFDTFLLLGANLALLTTYPEPGAALARLARIANPGAQLLGSDIRMAEVPPPSRLRARVEHLGVAGEWSRWEGGRPYVHPARIGDVLEGTAWRVEEILDPPRPDGDGYLARLILEE